MGMVNNNIKDKYRRTRQWAGSSTQQQHGPFCKFSALGLKRPQAVSLIIGRVNRTERKSVHQNAISCHKQWADEKVLKCSLGQKLSEWSPEVTRHLCLFLWLLAVVLEVLLFLWSILESCSVDCNWVCAVEYSPWVPKKVLLWKSGKWR